MLTQKHLKEVLHYFPDTGLFIWKKSLMSRIRIGSVAGSKAANGYIAIQVARKVYRAHRLAFLYMEGYLPEHDVDHKNGIKGDNRWCNLRHVTHSCNMQNQKISIINKSGYTGVSWHKGVNKWRAIIQNKGKFVCLGCYDDKISAALARCEAEKCLPDWKCNNQGINFVKLRELGYMI